MIEYPAFASVNAALANAMRLLEEDPELAAEQARQILMAMPRTFGIRFSQEFRDDAPSVATKGRPMAAFFIASAYFAAGVRTGNGTLHRSMWPAGMV